MPSTSGRPFCRTARLVFDWNKSGHDSHGGYDTATADVWSSDGAPEGTRSILSWATNTAGAWWGGGCSSTLGLGTVVGPTAYLRTHCWAKDTVTWMGTATRGLHSNTFDLPGYNHGPVVRTGNLVVYSALASNRGRELFVSDGTREGSHLLRDIWPGSPSSGIGELVSHESYATFTADDGHGRARWWTNGTPAGTHKVRQS